MTASLVFATSAILALAAGALVRRLALHFGAVVHPRPDRWHRRATPTYGGVAVVCGLVAGLGLASNLQIDAALVLGASAVLFVVGWYDDLRPLSAVAKLVNTLAVASFFLFCLTYFGVSPVPAALSLVAIIWFGGLDNAVNLLDNMDGLAAGVTAIAALGLAATFSVELGPALTTLLIALAGGLTGFLAWNRPPARLFMGNCGSLAVGAILAGCSTIIVARTGTITAAVAVSLILMTPLLDSTFVVLLRRLAGRSTTRGNVDHTSHRLVSAGFSEGHAVLTLYAVGLAGAVTGFVFQTSGPSTWPLAALFAVAAGILALYLAKVPAYEGQDFRVLQESAFAPLLTDLTFRWHAFEILLDLVLITVCYYTAYRIRFEGEALSVFLSTFGASMTVVLGCQLAGLYVSGLYERVWSSFGFHDLWTVVRGVAIGSMLSVLAAAWLFKFERFSRSVFIIDAVLLVSAIVLTRLSFRIIQRVAVRSSARRVLIYGAGSRGELLVRELFSNPSWQLDPIGFVDDDRSKLARKVHGLPVRGCLADLEPLLSSRGVEEVILSSPTIPADVEARTRALCARHNVTVRRLHFDIR